MLICPHHLVAPAWVSEDRPPKNDFCYLSAANVGLTVSCRAQSILGLLIPRHEATVGPVLCCLKSGAFFGVATKQKRLGCRPDEEKSGFIFYLILFRFTHVELCGQMG